MLLLSAPATNTLHSHIISMVSEMSLKIHEFHLLRHGILRPNSWHTGAIMLPTNENGRLLLTALFFFDRCSLDYWSFSMTGNICGGQQSPAHSCGSYFPSEFNAVTGCRYRQSEKDTLKRLSLYVTAMSINNHVLAVKTFTLCSYKWRNSAMRCVALHWLEVKPK